MTFRSEVWQDSSSGAWGIPMGAKRGMGSARRSSLPASLRTRESDLRGGTGGVRNGDRRSSPNHAALGQETKKGSQGESSSASLWGAPWSPSRGCSYSTNRSLRSTGRSAQSCVRSFDLGHCSEGCRLSLVSHDEEDARQLGEERYRLSAGTLSQED